MNDQDCDYLFSITRGAREAKIYSSMELDDYYRVECLLDGELVVARDNSELDYCREVGETFVLEQS